MNSAFEHMLRAIRAEQLVFSDEPGSGAIENMRVISLPNATADASADLQALLHSVVDHYRSTLECTDFPVTFYAWHDEMAGQLRFSVARSSPERLPFGAIVDLVADADVVIAEFLNSPYRDGIPWDHLTEASADQLDEPLQYHLKVWAVSLRTPASRAAELTP
jgi:hypothetical protein